MLIVALGPRDPALAALGTPPRPALRCQICTRDEPATLLPRPGRLSRLEIHAWEADEGVELERWERRAIMAIDEAWMKTVSEDLKDQKGASK